MVENNMGIIVSMYMSAEVKYMWKLEFSNSSVNFHWDLSLLLGKFMCPHFYSVSSGSEKVGRWGWPHLVEIKLPGENWWNNFSIQRCAFPPRRWFAILFLMSNLQQVIFRAYHESVHSVCFYNIYTSLDGTWSLQRSK